MTKPLISLGPLTPKAWVRKKWLRPKWSEKTRPQPTLTRTTKGLDSKNVRRQEGFLEDAEDEEIGPAVIGRKRLGVRNGGMQEMHSPQIIALTNEAKTKLTDARTRQRIKKLLKDGS